MSNDIALITKEIRDMQPTLAPMLPANISPERFASVAITAIEQDPDLLNADRQSLYIACKRAAQDGLLPDKRQGAFVIFNEKSGDRWIKKVQWMPMRQGLIDKAAKYGVSIDSQVVYEKDEFRYVLGDEPRIEHAPYMKGERGPIVCAYAIATMPDGLKRREVMPKIEIDAARAVSRSKDSGPWAKWYGEMARKTVIRRLFKSLPFKDVSEEDKDVFYKDDDVIDMPAIVEGDTQVDKLKSQLKQQLAGPPADAVAPRDIIADLEDAARESLEALEHEWKSLTAEERKQLGKQELERLKARAEAARVAKQSNDDWLEANA